MNCWSLLIFLTVLVCGNCKTTNNRYGNNYQSNYNEIDNHEMKDKYPDDNEISKINIVEEGSLVDKVSSDNMYPGEGDNHEQMETEHIDHGKEIVKDNVNYIGDKDMKDRRKYTRTAVGFGGPLGMLGNAVISGGTQLLGGAVGSGLLGGAIGHIGNAVIEGGKHLAGHLGNFLGNFGPQVLGHVGNVVAGGTNILGSIGNEVIKNSANIGDNLAQGSTQYPTNGKPDTSETDSGNYYTFKHLNRMLIMYE